MDWKTGNLIRVDKKDIIKPPFGKKSDTALCNVRYDMEPNITDSGSWTGVLNWKNGGLRSLVFYAENLENIVKQVNGTIRTVLVSKKGEIDSVDIIYKMPSLKDHQMTLKYEEAIKQ